MGVLSKGLFCLYPSSGTSSHRVPVYACLCLYPSAWSGRILINDLIFAGDIRYDNACDVRYSRLAARLRLRRRAFRVVLVREAERVRRAQNNYGRFR